MGDFGIIGQRIKTMRIWMSEIIPTRILFRFKKGDIPSSLTFCWPILGYHGRFKLFPEYEK